METTLLSKTFTASSDIAAYRIITFHNKDYEVKQATANTQSLIGVSGEFDAKAQEPIDVKMVGIVRVRYGGNVTRGTLVTTNQNGEAITAASNNNFLGIALLSGKDNEIGSVLLSPGFR